MQRIPNVHRIFQNSSKFYMHDSISTVQTVGRSCQRPPGNRHRDYGRIRVQTADGVIRDLAFQLLF